jgi:beta-N-acetylhexosaminidase
MELIPFDAGRAEHVAAATAVWNAACGPDLSFGERFMQYNTSPAFWNRPGRAQAGRLAWRDGRAVGFALASVVLAGTSPAEPPTGHIDALAVLPEAQRRGLGRQLAAWAEGWLGGQGCRSCVPGASFRTFVPGPPVELGSAGFFRRLGYAPNAGYERCVDMAADLRDYATPDTARKARGVLARPARPADEDALLGFLKREFPTGWYHECRELLDAGSRISDYVILESARGVDGCLLTTFEDSYRPLDRFYPHRLPRPWGQLGSVGVSADCRGQGYGAALMDGALRCLRDRGVRGCVIDWLVIVNFYARFGFGVHRSYDMLSKRGPFSA